LAGGSAREQQISDIGAGDEKDEPDCAEQNEERWFNVANYLFVERDHNGASPCVVGRILVFQPRSNCIHLDPRLLQRDARFEAANYFEEMIAALRRLLRRKCNRHPELIVPILKPRQLHQGRHDSHNCVAFAVQSQRAADNSRIGSETSLPQRMAENHNVRAGFVIFLHKSASKASRYA
jgi:hypothetical protein